MFGGLLKQQEDLQHDKSNPSMIPLLSNEFDSDTQENYEYENIPIQTIKNGKWKNKSELF